MQPDTKRLPCIHQYADPWHTRHQALAMHPQVRIPGSPICIRGTKRLRCIHQYEFLAHQYASQAPALTYVCLADQYVSLTPGAYYASTVHPPVRIPGTPNCTPGTKRLLCTHQYLSLSDQYASLAPSAYYAYASWHINLHPQHQAFIMHPPIRTLGRPICILGTKSFRCIHQCESLAHQCASQAPRTCYASTRTHPWQTNMYPLPRRYASLAGNQFPWHQALTTHPPVRIPGAQKCSLGTKRLPCIQQYASLPHEYASLAPTAYYASTSTHPCNTNVHLWHQALAVQPPIYIYIYIYI